MKISVKSPGIDLLQQPAHDRLPGRRWNVKPVSWPLRLIAWWVIVVQFGYGVPGAAAAAVNATVAVVGQTLATVTTSAPAANSAGQKPAAQPLWKNDLEAQIGAARVFVEPLVPVGDTTEVENRALLAALTTFSKRTNGDDFAVLQQFLDTHPHSVWRPSLLTGLGIFFKQQGYFSRALAAWHEAWELCGQSKSERGRTIADLAAAEYVRLTAAVGNADALESMLNAIKDRQLSPAVYNTVADARDTLASLRRKPALMYTCGSQALQRIRDIEGKSILPPEILDARATEKGFSLDDVMHLASRIQMDYQMAWRAPGAKIILPAVLHLKVGHYVALVKTSQNRYLIQDPGTGDDLWVTAAALDDEASGYCLVRTGTLPAGWRAVAASEAKTIWGRGPVANSDTKQLKKTSSKCGSDCPPKKGMPFYHFHTMLVSLNVEDTPLGYLPAYGPAINFTLTYNQRDDTQPSTINYPNVGRNWTFDWLSYIEDQPLNPTATITRYLPGGGKDTYAYDGSNFVPDTDSHTKLIRTGSGGSATYEVDFPDGSKCYYTTSDGGSSVRKVFLTQVKDSQGNSISFTWAAGRLTDVTDAVGAVTHLTYGSENSVLSDFYRIATVTDHSNGQGIARVASLQYDSAGQLVKITDVIGMSSSFNYDSTGFMIGMTTPYGTTAFATGIGSVGNDASARWLEATDPLGQKERLEYNQSTDNGIPSSEDTQLVPSVSGVLPPLANQNLWYRNSFFWGKKTMQEMGGVINSASYAKAFIYHWLHSQTGVASGTLESFKSPQENRIWFRYPGQGERLDHPEDAWTEGSSTSPAYVAWVLDDGTTQLSRFTYNDFGHVTAAIDPLGRTTRFIYDLNQIDLLEVRQDQPASQTGDPNGGDLLTSFTCDPTYPRLVHTVKDASGQTTTFNYGDHGQLASIVNAKGKTTSYVYDYPGHPGFLHTITGPTSVSGAVTTFTPDAYDRVQTVTSPDNFTVSYAYDSLDRLTQTTYPDSTTEQIKYVNLDPILIKDRQNRWTGLEYDAQRHLVAVKDSLGRVTQYNWCACGDLESIIDANTNVTTFVRDLQGRVIRKIFPDASAMGYAYEPATGRLMDVTDAMGQTTHYDYNVDDTVQQVSYHNAVVPTPSVFFTYDPRYNRVTTMRDGVGTTTYNYNPVTTTPALGAGRLGSVVSTFPASTISYSYDELGRAFVRNIDSKYESRTFDDLGRVATIINGLGQFVYTPHTFGGSPENVMDYPNGAKLTATSYDGSDLQNQGRLKTLLYQFPSTGTIDRYDYQYDVVGRISAWTQQVGTDPSTFYQFKYDLAGQLVDATLKNGSPASPGLLVKQYIYSYDNLGNRTTASLDTPATANTAAYNNLNQQTKRTPGQRTLFSGTLTGTAARDVTINGVPATLTGTPPTSFQGYATASSDNPVVTVVATDSVGYKNTKKYSLTINPSGTPTTLTYDLNGNLIASVTGTTVDSFEWDAVNRLVAINHRTSGTAITRSEFTYDGLGRRVKIVERDTTGSIISTKTFVWDGMEMCQERDAAGTTITKQYFAQGDIYGAEKHFYVRDHLGSIREAFDCAGGLVTHYAKYDYDPYGNRTKLSGGYDCDFGFGGYYYHAPSGLYLTPYRAYDPNSGRWLSRDPIGEAGGINLFGFVGNDPVNLVDPLGLAFGNPVPNISITLPLTLQPPAAILPSLSAPDNGPHIPITSSQMNVSDRDLLFTLGGGGLADTQVGQQNLDSFKNMVAQTVLLGKVKCPAAENTGTALARQLGRAGEDAVGITGPKTAIEIPGSGQIRIPDALTDTTLKEVKNVRSLSYLQQLRDFTTYSQANGLNFQLWVRPSTQLSGPLQQAIANGQITLKFIPGAP